MSQHKGLSAAEVQAKLAQYGRNEIVEKRSHSAWQILASQFTSVLVILLMVAAVASVFLGDTLDGVFILLIVILNGILGFVQEYKAEKAIAALKQLTNPTTRVIRDGVEQKIDSTLLVPGDIVLVEEGDKVPADARLIESFHLEANESTLTGESMPVEKNTFNDEHNMIYMGTIVAKGRAYAQVKTTGMQTKFGNIAATLATIEDEETPLQKKLDVLGKQLGLMALGASAIVLIVGVLSHIEWVELLLTSISLAVAAVPEGLPAVITVTLAVGMQRMARKKAILRKLSAIEALGSTTVIATDKTGTLTRNQMHVVKLWYDEKTIDHKKTASKVTPPTLIQILEASIYCNNASVMYVHDHRRFDVLGDATEGALLLMAADHDRDVETVKRGSTFIEEFAFDPTLKLMSVVWKVDGKKKVYTKGAPETVLSRSSFIMNRGVVKKLTVEARLAIENEYRAFARKGLRVLALATRDISVVPKKREGAETDLVFLGFVGIADPPRPEVAEAIGIAQLAGIRTIMITGDNELTANAIGTSIGLLKKGEHIVTGAQFASMNDAEAMAQLPSIRIFARTTPDQKFRIVSLLQRMGHTVAVTGDGVNDALAIKQAHIGVSMGITGSDVAKEASDMVLLDDNYATLVTAVEEGRVIFDNIKAAVKYLVGCNVGEVVAVIVGMMLGWPLILTPLQLLYINLVTDGLPAIALASTPKHDGIMKRKPRGNGGMFEKQDVAWFSETSLLTAITTLFAFWLGNRVGGIEVGRTFAFTTIILAQHFILLDVWTRETSVFRTKIFTSSLFLIAFFVPLMFQPLLIYVPQLAHTFDITGIPVTMILTTCLIASVVLVASEVRKLIRLGK